MIRNRNCANASYFMGGNCSQSSVNLFAQLWHYFGNATLAQWLHKGVNIRAVSIIPHTPCIKLLLYNWMLSLSECDLGWKFVLMFREFALSFLTFATFFAMDGLAWLVGRLPSQLWYHLLIFTGNSLISSHSLFLYCTVLYIVCV